MRHGHFEAPGLQFHTKSDNQYNCAADCFQHRPRAHEQQEPCAPGHVIHFAKCSQGSRPCAHTEDVHVCLCDLLVQAVFDQRRHTQACLADAQLDLHGQRAYRGTVLQGNCCAGCVTRDEEEYRQQLRARIWHAVFDKSVRLLPTSHGHNPADEGHPNGHSSIVSSLR